MHPEEVEQTLLVEGEGQTLLVEEERNRLEKHTGPDQAERTGLDQGDLK